MLSTSPRCKSARHGVQCCFLRVQVSTLRFADRAKQIKNKPKIQLDPKDAKIAELMEEIEELKHRLKKYEGDGGGEEEQEQEVRSLSMYHEERVFTGVRMRSPPADSTRCVPHSIRQAHATTLRRHPMRTPRHRRSTPQNPTRT